MNRNLAVILAWFVCSAMLHAEQLRVAVAAPEIVADTDPAKKEAAGYASLWQSLVVAELSGRDRFAIVDRDDLSALAKEWALRLETAKPDPGINRPTWQGADCLVIGRMSAQSGKYDLTVRVINTPHGAVEKEFTYSFAPAELETKAREFAAQFEGIGRILLSQRDIHTLVSVLDFENVSPFDRNRWLETALARRLRGALQRQPGVLVFERENVTALFDEVRLQRGGLTTGLPGPTNRWASLRNFFLVSGRINESQPEGQPLAFALETQIRNLADDGVRRVENKFLAGDIEAGLTRLEEQVVPALLQVKPGEWPAGRTEPDRTAEALVLANRAVQLMKLPDLKSLDFIDDFSWEIPPHAFSDAAHAFDVTPQRRAAVLRAVQYLKAAQMLDERNARLKVFLSSLLADRSAQETELAVELAEEIGWQYPRFQSRAWWFIFGHTTGEKRHYYRQRVMSDHPGTWEAKQAVFSVMSDLVQKHQGAPDLGNSIEAYRALMDQSLSWGGYIEGDVMYLFQLTQITGRNPAQRQKQYELRDAASRERGTQVLEEMIRKYPKHAFNLTCFWMNYWDYYTDKQDVIDAWIRRTSDAALKTDRDPWLIGVRADPCRLQLARRLMERGQHQEALGYLELVSNYHSLSAATFMIGECAFALGDYPRALIQFQTFGTDHREAAKYHKDATAWADKCRTQLHLPAKPAAAPVYSASAANWTWKVAPFPLPSGTISAMVADGAELWIGVKNSIIWADPNVIMLENDPVQMTNALKQGGLVRVHPGSGQVTTFEVGKAISHPWVMCLAVADGRVWVGTFGKGIDVFHPATGRWSNISEQDGLPSNFIQCMEADKESLWVGTGRFGRGGVARFRFKTRQWQSYLPGDSPNAPPPTAPVTGMKRVAGRLWCALPTAIYSYDLEANRWSRRSSGNQFTAIAACAGRIWFGADQFDPPGPLSGILHCNLLGEDWQTLRQLDGLPDMAVTAMAENAGRLLLGTYGFMMLDPVKKTFTTCDLRKDTAKWSYVVSSLLVADGRLWMACRNDRRLHFLDWPARSAFNPNARAMRPLRSMSLVTSTPTVRVVGDDVRSLKLNSPLNSSPGRTPCRSALPAGSGRVRTRRACPVPPPGWRGV